MPDWIVITYCLLQRDVMILQASARETPAGAETKRRGQKTRRWEGARTMLGSAPRDAGLSLSYGAIRLVRVRRASQRGAGREVAGETARAHEKLELEEAAVDGERPGEGGASMYALRRPEN